MDIIELVKKYAPSIYFNENEPFFPLRVGYTVFEKDGASPSTERMIHLKKGACCAIEYAIYWDFDIQHLYELEHVWVYIGNDGMVADCEASFHGRHMKALLRDRSNIEKDTHVRVYSQPGKHAFSPIKQLFELIPGAEEAVGERAGADGLLVTGPFEDKLETTDEIQALVEGYLKKFSFQPSDEYVPYSLPDSIYKPWKDLEEEIPGLIEKKLREMGYTGPSPVISK